MLYDDDNNDDNNNDDVPKRFSVSATVQNHEALAKNISKNPCTEQSHPDGYPKLKHRLVILSHIAMIRM